MKTWQLLLIFIPLAYLVGSINFASIIAHFKKRNIKELGSGNPGTMNMIRSVGKFWGCATFLLDFFKGVAIALVGKFAFSENIPFAMTVLSIIVVGGHIFSLFLRFKGGKGVATTFGVFGVINPFLMLGAFVLLLIYLKLFKTGFLGSLICVGSMTITSFFLELFYVPTGWASYVMMYSPVKDAYSYATAVLYFVLFAFIIFTHRSNIKRFIKKEELSLSLFGNDTAADKTPEETCTTTVDSIATANDNESCDNSSSDTDSNGTDTKHA